MDELCMCLRRLLATYWEYLSLTYELDMRFCGIL